MKPYQPRIIKFKAWNKETKLLMRLNSIDCKKGELVKDHHYLLQFTGMVDKQEEEIYEMDIMLAGTEKYVVMWDDVGNGWTLCHAEGTALKSFSKSDASGMIRLCNFFESQSV